MKNSNIFFLLIDNFRIDSFDNQKKSRKLFPNFSSLIKKGFLKKIISNGQATKFVMPSLFSQTYPLDYDGYNYAITNRPKSFAEILKENNYSTHMFQADDNDGPISNCDRGFDFVESIYDRRLLLQNYIEEVLSYELKNILNRKPTRKKLLKTLENFKNLLFYIGRSCNRVNRLNVPPELRSYDSEWSKKIFKEIEILEKDPYFISQKILKVSAQFYYLLLGEKKTNSKKFFIKKKIYGILNRFQLFFNMIGFFPFKVLTFRKVALATEVLNGAFKVIKNKQNFFIYAHLMDLHDRKLINRPLQLIKKLLKWPYWFFLSKDKSFKRFLYDISLHFLDFEVGKFVKYLKKNEKFKNTILIFTGDHGCDMYDKIKRGRDEVFGFRTHYEHITVPLIYVNSNKKENNSGLHDTMSISASLLDNLQIKKHKSFRGISVFRKGKNIIISENADRGNCDLLNKDLFFTLTGSQFKMMFLVKQKRLLIERLYDLKSDPYEIKNLVFNDRFHKILKKNIDIFFIERKNILEKRCITKNNIYIKDKVFLYN